MRRSAQSKRYWLVQLVSFLLMLVVSPFGNSPLAAQTVASASRVHRTAPNFSLVDLNHKKIELTSYRGKVVLLTFWATWCAPCLTEMPTFAEWQQQYGSEKFQVIGVSMDDAAPEVIATVSKLKLNYPVVMGDEHLGAAYGGILGLPVTLLIDREGKIHARYQSTDLARMKDDIQSLLKSK
jgi:cytochrome c biogenesis protein CcmG/thiol:disulfide interchange protein DsbE